MAKDYETPKPPAAPAKRLPKPPSRDYDAGVDRATPEDMALQTRGPLTDESDVARQLRDEFITRTERQNKDIRRGRKPKREKRPLQVRGGRGTRR